MGKDALSMMFEGTSINDILLMDKFKTISDSELEHVILDLIKNNQQQSEKVKTNPKLIGWFVGQVMKATGGKVDAKVVNEMLNKHFQLI